MCEMLVGLCIRYRYEAYVRFISILSLQQYTVAYSIEKIVSVKARFLLS